MNGRQPATNSDGLAASAASILSCAESQFTSEARRSLSAWARCAGSGMNLLTMPRTLPMRSSMPKAMAHSPRNGGEDDDKRADGAGDRAPQEGMPRHPAADAGARGSDILLSGGCDIGHGKLLGSGLKKIDRLRHREAAEQPWRSGKVACHCERSEAIHDNRLDCFVGHASSQ